MNDDYPTLSRFNYYFPYHTNNVLRWTNVNGIIRGIIIGLTVKFVEV